MTAKFRAFSTQTNTTGVNGTSLVVTKPAETAPGDVMIAVTGAMQGGDFTAPAGWVHLDTVLDAAGLESRAYKKIAGASEPASYTWTFTTGTGSAINISIVSFAGGRDVLDFANTVTTTTDPAFGKDLASPRNAVSWKVYCWQNATANSTVTWSFTQEKHDITSKATGAIWRGQSGHSYAPPDHADIVNIGDLMPTAEANPSQAPTHGVFWDFLIDEQAPDDEQWDETDGSFAVDLNLDTNQVNETGGITSVFRGDITGDLVATSSSLAPETPAYDGLTTTHWFVNATSGFLQYDFGVGVTKRVKRYRISSSADFHDRDPRDWTLKGSNDGTNFDVLDTRTDEGFGQREETREFRVATPGDYRYYRLDITSNYSPGVISVTRVAEFRLSDIDVWEDITEFVTEEDKIRIVRGLQGSSGRSDASRAYMSLNNTDGRFTLRKADGKYHGALQRNNQLRVSKAFGTKSLQLQGDVQLEGTNMCGDGARTILTSDLAASVVDVRIDVEPESWRQEQMLCGVSSSPDGESPWNLSLTDDGRLRYFWYDNANFEAFSTVAIDPTNRLSIRVTQDVQLGENTVTFYTADTFNGSWVQLGDESVIAVTTAPLYEGGALCIGHLPSQSIGALHGMVYNFELRDGIDGTLVSDIDFTALDNGVHTWTENAHEWVTINNGVVSNRRYRFHGEVAEWPLNWDPTGTWVTAPITAAGIQKRLEKSNSELSAMRRYHTKGIIADPGAFDRYATPLQYWPIEDQPDTFVISSGIPSRPSMRIAGSPEFGAEGSDAFHESGNLPKLNGAQYGGRISGIPSGYFDMRFLFYAPTAPTNNANIITFYTTGTIRKWEVDFQAAGLWRIEGYNEAAIDTGVPTVTASSIAVITTGELMHVRIVLEESGADIRFAIDAFDVFGEELANTTVTLSSANFRQLTQVEVNAHPTIKLSDAYFGHLAIYGAEAPSFGGSELNAHHYETAGRRIQRLAAEEQTEFRYIGALDESEFMGYQDTSAAFPLMSSAAHSDDGYLVDPLDAFGLEYRTLRTLLNQAAHLTLSYTGNELSGEIAAAGDDAHITNDFIASRGDAGSARYQRSDGPLSVQPPPDGVGPYNDSQSYSLAHEGQCVDIASWQVHKGTIDEERYPRIQVALENARIQADPALTERILLLDVGDRLDITDTPDHLPTEDIRQVVIGYEEWFDNFQHFFTLNCIPERSFEVARYGEDDRFENHDSFISQDVSAAATTFEVGNALYQPWSDVAGPFDIVINGERMTVTNVDYVTSSYTTDSFNRANSTTTLGSTDGGTTAAWTAQLNTWGINANAAYVPASADSIATISGGTADLDICSITATTLPATRAFWIVFRFSNTTNYWRWGGTLGATMNLEKVVAGVATAHLADTRFVAAQGDTLSVTCLGSVIEVMHNGRTALTVTDSFNQTATLHGMRTTTNDVRLDNFELRVRRPRQLFTVTRGVGPTDAAYHLGLSEIHLYKKPYRGK